MNEEQCHGQRGDRVGRDLRLRRPLRRADACTRHRERGAEVCPVTVMQPMDEVEAALVEVVQREILTLTVVESRLRRSPPSGRGADAEAGGRHRGVRGRAGRASDRADLREVFLALFPDGLTFTPAWAHDKRRRRRVWHVKGAAQLLGSECVATPPPEKSPDGGAQRSEATERLRLRGDPNGTSEDHLDNSV